MKIGVVGPQEWVDICRDAATGVAALTSMTTENDWRSAGAVLLSGASVDLLGTADRALRNGIRVYLRNPERWSLAELTHLLALSEESSADVGILRSWHSSFQAMALPFRQIQVDVEFSEPINWNKILGNAVDLILFVLGTDSILRIEAIRSVGEEGQLSMLMATLRFQNGSMAQISMKASAQERVSAFVPGAALSVLLREESEASIVREFLIREEAIPGLPEAVGARKIEEKIFSVLRTK